LTVSWGKEVKSITIKKDVRVGKVILEAGEKIRIIKSRIYEDDFDVKKVIKDLQGDFGGDNQNQMKGVQLLKGLATSDDPLANKYMEELNTATTEISKKVLQGNF